MFMAHKNEKPTFFTNIYSRSKKKKANLSLPALKKIPENIFINPFYTLINTSYALKTFNI